MLLLSWLPRFRYIDCGKSTTKQKSTMITSTPRGPRSRREEKSGESYKYERKKKKKKDRLTALWRLFLSAVSVRYLCLSVFSLCVSLSLCLVSVPLSQWRLVHTNKVSIEEIHVRMWRQSVLSKYGEEIFELTMNITTNWKKKEREQSKQLETVLLRRVLTWKLLTALNGNRIQVGEVA